MSWLELYKEVNITIGAEVLTKNGTEQRKLLNVVAAAKFRAPTLNKMHSNRPTSKALPAGVLVSKMTSYN